MTQPTEINHIGIAVKSLDAQRHFYETVLGARFEGIEEVPDQRVRVAFFAVGEPGNEVHIELLEPTAPDSPISAFLEKRGEGLHHVAYAVPDLAARLTELKAHGVRLIDEAPRPGARGSRVAFIHPKASMGVLTELCQPTSHSTP
jgi:methylmalonyl-CoA/ethylmalonyl-CoA epimerase